MKKHILSGYGPDASKSSAPRAKSGGVTKAVDVLGYAKPQGPIGIGNRKVGLGGDNYGPCGTQGKHGDYPSESGGVGIGVSRSKSGAQRS